jgi:ApbE superfamily uncharacterized protein (UPF0280 family)
VQEVSRISQSVCSQRTKLRELELRAPDFCIMLNFVACFTP